MMTPGTYLKLRRQAAGLSVDDVAGLVHTAPHLGAFDRSAWIGRIESDVAAISPDVVRALASAFRFDRRVLLRLIDLRSYGTDIGVTPRICAICACSDADPCLDEQTHRACAWVSADLCSGCAPTAKEETARAA